MDHVFDLEYIAIEMSTRNEDYVVGMNIIGLSHVFLMTVVTIIGLYILVIRNLILKQEHIITNIWLLCMIGQWFSCLGLQIQFLYYKAVSIDVVIFGVIFSREFGIATVVIGLIYISLGYKYIGIKKEYDFYYNTLYKKHFIWIYFAYIGTYLFLACVSVIFIGAFYALLMVFSVVFHCYMYYKLGKEKCDNFKQQHIMYKMGFYGSLMLSIVTASLVYFSYILNFDATSQMLGTILTGFSYLLITVGLTYIVKEFESFEHFPQSAEKVAVVIDS